MPVLQLPSLDSRFLVVSTSWVPHTRNERERLKPSLSPLRLTSLSSHYSRTPWSGHYLWEIAPQ